MRIFQKLVFLVCFFCAHHLCAWWDQGHQVVAQIAYEQLREEVKQKADALCEILCPFYPECIDFVHCSIWADEIKDLDRLPLFNSLHYTTIPYDPDHILNDHIKDLLAQKNNENDIVFCIKTARKIFQNKKASPLEKALMLRLVIHCIGDIHQPMHCCTLFDHNFPLGDRGGNEYPLRGKYKNLHYLWDDAAGIFAGDSFDPKKSAEELSKKYSKRLFERKIRIRSVHRWAQESYKIGQELAYQIPLEADPDAIYLQNVQKICEQQILLAGYRLAAFLNEGL